MQPGMQSTAPPAALKGAWGAAAREKPADFSYINRLDAKGQPCRSVLRSPLPLESLASQVAACGSYGRGRVRWAMQLYVLSNRKFGDGEVCTAPTPLLLQAVAAAVDLSLRPAVPPVAGREALTHCCCCCCCCGAGAGAVGGAGDEHHPGGAVRLGPPPAASRCGGVGRGHQAPPLPPGPSPL